MFELPIYLAGTSESNWTCFNPSIRKLLSANSVASVAGFQSAPVSRDHAHLVKSPSPHFLELYSQNLFCTLLNTTGNDLTNVLSIHSPARSEATTHVTR